MSSTAHEDQFTAEPEPVRQPYDAGSILRRNVADLEIALKQQTERAEAAEAELLAVREDNHSMMLEIDGLRKELARLREQEPVAYVKYKATGGNVGLSWFAIPTQVYYPREGEPLYAAPVPAPAVPNDIRSAVCSMLCALDAAIAGDRAHYINKSERARSVSRNWNAANVARAKVVSLLQSGSEPQKEYAWECNECGAQEYTMSVGQSIIESGALACGSCGCDEFHKAEVRHD